MVVGPTAAEVAGDAFVVVGDGGAELTGATAVLMVGSCVLEAGPDVTDPPAG